MTENFTQDGSDVVFYQLNTKFVDNDREISKESEEVLYYSLSIGHHTGVIDCFGEKFRCSKKAYLEVIEALPAESDARYKLEGIFRHGEIQIDKSHLPYLPTAVDRLLNEDAGALSPEAQSWLKSFSESLGVVRSSPVVYLMAREQKP